MYRLEIHLIEAHNVFQVCFLFRDPLFFHAGEDMTPFAKERPQELAACPMLVVFIVNGFITNCYNFNNYSL